MKSPAELNAIASRVQGIIFDVDGVLTDGRIIYSDDGTEQKQFHVQDGASLKLLAHHGIEVAIITGRESVMVTRRAAELGITHIMQGVGAKDAALMRLMAAGFPGQSLAAVGDDIQDLALFDHASVDLAITVPNAHPAILKRADFTTQRNGGCGVAVEIAELLLKAQGKWSF